jgi:hypothetical protein
MKHQITVLLGCAMLLGACNKENVVETPTAPVAMSYKIQPAKIGELRHFAEMKKAGTSFRLSEESFSAEEFWLYTESVVNSLITEMEEIPDETHERVISYNHEGEYNTSGLIDAITSIKEGIEQDLATVLFQSEGTPYVHIVDVKWNVNQNNVDVLYIAGVTTNTVVPPSSTWQMSMHPNSNCTDYALNGQMQRLMHAFWNTQSSPASRFRPNYLYSPPLWNHNYIPCCWTYTEVETRTVDYENANQRSLYSVNGPYLELWHRTTFGLNNPPACLPDVVNSWPRTLQGHARGTAQVGINLNPDPYFYPNNLDGLVLIGFHIEARSLQSNLPPLSIPNSQGNQKEDWHKVTYTYGRQISLNAPTM